MIKTWGRVGVSGTRTVFSRVRLRLTEKVALSKDLSRLGGSCAGPGRWASRQGASQRKTLCPEQGAGWHAADQEGGQWSRSSAGVMVRADEGLRVTVPVSRPCKL